MSWGTELWDQFDRITDHSQKGIEFCEKYSHYVKDRSKIEVDYANALRRLSKNYLPKRKEEESPFTVVKSFYDSIKEVNDVAGQHELLAEQFQSSIVKEIAALMAELKTERKKQMEEAKKLEQHLQKQLQNLDNTKRKYERSHAEQVRAQEMYRAADENLNLSRAEVEKSRTISIQRGQFCSDCKAGYAQVLEQTNSHQRDYYNKHLPQVFQSMQELDEKRIQKIQSSMKQMSDIEKSIQPIINTCLEGVTQASQKIDHSEDSRRVIDRFKSGFVPPGDIPFEDLGNEDNKSINSNTSNKVGRSETLRASSGTKKEKKDKSRGVLKGIFGGRSSEPEREDFGHLPPQQQKKQLKEKIKQIKHEVTKELSGREALVKMHEVYTTNPKLGDANSINSQLEDSKAKLDGLDSELAKYEGYLAAADGNGNGGTPTMARRSSVGSYQSTNSDTPSTPQAVNGTPAQSTPNTMSVSQTPHRQASTAMADSFDDEDFDDNEGQAAEGEPLAVIGKATALYTFEATTVGSLSVEADEEMNIVEHDNGDGWTRIRRNNGEEGFVPTSYMRVN